jgi:serine/threonine protein kinase
MTTLLSRYKIIKQIGEGAFGDTYLAEDTALPGSPHCVVKRLKRNPDPSVLAIAKRLFEEEAKVLQNFGKHDQIPSLAAYFEEKDEFYLVQEFVDGYDLNQEIVFGKKWTEEQTIKLLIDILEILAVVHQQNIIHRDIKPSNIMRRHQDGKIVLIDFGAVKEIGVYTVNSKGQTSLTVGIGTPGYMPGEQAGGKPKFASDIYAVGMIGIQAVTGLVPGQFQEDSNTGEIIWRNYAQVSDEFAEVLNKMVRDHFSQRYKNATEALEALIPPDKTIVVPPPPPKKFPTKIMLGLGMAVAISFAGGYIVNQGLSYQAALTATTKKAEEFLKQGNDKLDKRDSQGAINTLTEAIRLDPKFAEAYSRRGVAYSNIENNKKAIDDSQKSAKLFATQGNNSASKRNQGIIRYYLKDYQGAIALYNEAINLNPNYVEAYNARGLAHDSLGDKQAAIADYTQAIKINPNYAKAYHNRGNVRSDLGDKQAAIADYTQAIKINPNYIIAYNGRGIARSDLGDKQAAIADYTQAIKINPNYSEAYNNRGIARSDLGDKQAAITDYTQAIKINPNYARAYYNRGVDYSNLGDKQAAIADFQQAVKLYQQQGGNEKWLKIAQDRIRELQK